MIKSVVREHHWSPEIMSSLFHDGIDYFGLEWWYKDIIEVTESLKAKK